MRKQAALVVLSGGQDSTTCLFWAKQYYDEIHALTFDYGQRHHIELAAASSVAAHAGVTSHEILRIKDVLVSTSPLTDYKQDLAQYSSYDTMVAEVGERVEDTFVPLRNALFITIAANRAVARRAAHLVVGVCQADNANYPDCRAEFVRSQQETIQTALGTKDFELVTPLLHLNKAASIAMALRIPQCYEALAFTHTAYDGHYPPLGRDHATLLRAWGFREADIPDPLIIRAWREGLMALPNEPNYRPELIDWALQIRKVGQLPLSHAPLLPPGYRHKGEH